MDQIAATLGLKEMSQSVLMRKICTLSGHNRTRKAIFEHDKLVRTIYTLRYLLTQSCSVSSTARKIASSPTTGYAPPSRRLTQKGTDRSHGLGCSC